MARNFKETILKLLPATNYSLDLTQDQISSFENLRHLKPLFEWLSQSLSEANCITHEELEEFKKLQEKGNVEYGEELEEALQSHLYKDGNSLVPFKESLNDAEQEMTLLKEQLHHKQVLHQELCSSNAATVDEIHVLNKKQDKAEADHKEIIKNICATNKMLKDNVSEVQENVNDLLVDITELAQNIGSPEVSSDEGIHSLTSDNINPNRSLSNSVWSLSTTSSWQTIWGKDSNIKYMRQLSFDKYQRMHKQFLKRLTKLLEKLSKVGSFKSNSADYMDLHMIKKRLEDQMLILFEKEAELEGIRAARVKGKELYKTLSMENCLISRLKWEKNEVEDRREEDSFILNGGEELAKACQQWAECKALQVVEYKMRERIEFSKCLIEKMDELLNPLLLKLNADKILHEVLRYEKERIEMSINLYRSFHASLHNQFDQMRKRIEVIQNNLQDYEQFCALPLEERNDLVELLASIVLSDNGGVVQTVQHLNESSQREHEAMYEHYVLEKNKLVSGGKDMEESFNMAMSRTNNEADPAEVISSIQQGLDQIDSGIAEVYNDIQEVISISNGKEESSDEK